MSSNIESKFLKEKIKKLKEEIPNIAIPTMGIIEEENAIDIDNKDYLKIEVEEENKHVE